MYKSMLNKQTKFSDVKLSIADVKDSDVAFLDVDSDIAQDDTTCFVITKEEAKVFATENWDSTAHKQLRPSWDFRYLDDTAIVYAVYILRDNIAYKLKCESADMQQYA